MRAILLVLSLSVSIPLEAQEGASAAPIVFFSIAGPQGAPLQRFYHDVFGWPIGSDGTFSTPALSPLPALVTQEATAETIVYIGVPDISAALAKVTAAGGTMQYPRMAVPGRAVLALFRDPAGNRVGLIELENGKPKIP